MPNTKGPRLPTAALGLSTDVVAKKAKRKLSRKELRRAERTAKKQRKASASIAKKHVQHSHGKPKRVDSAKTSTKRRRPANDVAPERTVAAPRTNFERLLQEQALVPSLGSANDEDQEIEYLERKLGLSKSAKKNKEKSWARLDRELQEDGFAIGLTDFVRGLESSEDENGSDSSGGEDGEEDAEEEEEDDTESNEGKEDGQGESDAPAPHGASYLPSRNLYGEDLDVSPWLRRKRAAAAAGVTGNGGASGEEQRLQRRINGLLNRLTEDNVHPIATELTGLYREHGRAQLNAALSSRVLDSVTNDTQLLERLCWNFTALVAALSVMVGSEVGASLAEATVRRFQRLHGEVTSLAKEGKGACPRRSANVALILVGLYTYGVVHVGLLFDLADRLVHELNVADVEVALALLDSAGYRMRSEDPARLKGVVATVQQCVVSRIAAERSGKEDHDDGGGRLTFMLHGLSDLKNGKASAKSKHERAMDATRRLRKWLNHLQSPGGGGFAPLMALQVSWDDLEHAEERGRWWVVGAVWAGRRVEQSAGSTAPGTYTNSAAAAVAAAQHKRQAGGIGAALTNAEPRLLELARTNRMNTDVRRAVFVSIVGAADCTDAFDKVLKLGLKARQEREVVHVLVECCANGRTYNAFYAHLGARLCSYDHNFKFTFQLAFWDAFKQLDDMSTRRASNLARLLAHLVTSFSLSLAVLKIVDFTNLSPGTMHFFNVVLRAVLLYGGAERSGSKAVVQVFHRIGASSDAASLRDSLLLFLRTAFRTKYAGVTDEDARLLRKRVKLAIRVCDSLGVLEDAGEDST